MATRTTPLAVTMPWLTACAAGRGADVAIPERTTEKSCVTGTNGLDLDLLENVDACLFDGEGTDQAPSSWALHVYLEATVPRVRSCGTLRGVV